MNYHVRIPEKGQSRHFRIRANHSGGGTSSGPRAERRKGSTMRCRDIGRAAHEEQEPPAMDRGALSTHPVGVPSGSDRPRFIRTGPHALLWGKTAVWD